MQTQQELEARLSKKLLGAMLCLRNPSGPPQHTFPCLLSNIKYYYAVKTNEHRPEYRVVAFDIETIRPDGQCQNFGFTMKTESVFSLFEVERGVEMIQLEISSCLWDLIFNNE